jgi:hypothetical protein
MPWRNSDEHIMVTSAPTMSSLITSSGPCTPLVAGEAGPDAAMKNSDPGQRQAQVLRGAEKHARFDLQFFEVDVGLVEAVEQHQSVGAQLIHALGGSWPGC